MAQWIGISGPPGPVGPLGPEGPPGAPNPGAALFPVGTTVTFNGSTGNVSTPYTVPGGLTAMSVMAWVYVLGYLGGNPRVLANGHTDTDGNGFELWMNGGSQTLQATVGTSSGNPTITAPSAIAFQWVLAGITWDGATLRLWQNGQVVASTALSGTWRQAGHAFGIAYNSAYNGDYTHGLLAHVALWAGTALTADQWATLYTASWRTQTLADYEALVQNMAPTLYYPLQETSGTTAENLGTTGSTNNGTYNGGVTLGTTATPLNLAGRATVPNAPSTATLTSGTAWQNTTGADVWLTVPVTFGPTASAAASVAMGVGTTANPATAPVATEPAGAVSGAVHTLTAYVPANAYLLITATNATLGTATVQGV